MNLSPGVEAEGKTWNFLGLYSKNREEWVVADLAAIRSSVTVAPLFDSLGPSALAYAINEAELATLCIEKHQIDNLIKLKKEQTPSLTNLVVFDEVTQEQKDKGAEVDLKIYSYQDVLDAGKAHPEIVLKEPTTDTIMQFCYTSGTTGDAKGSKESHGQFLSNLYNFDFAGFGLNENDSHISYLPLGHAYEQSVFQKSIAHAFAYGFFSGDPLKLFEDLAVLKPTIFFTVPRILNRLYDKILDGLSKKSGFAQWIFNKGIAAKTYYLKEEGAHHHKFYDTIAFKKVRAVLGGNVRLIATGAAPIHPDILTFFRVVFGVSVHEGFGQSETLIVCITNKDDNTYGTVGGPGPANKFRLKDIQEMNYLSTDNPPRGELQIFGNTTFQGYFKKPDLTQQAITEDGWINTGDVACVLSNGSVKIIDRAKNIFKLA